MFRAMSATKVIFFNDRIIVFMTFAGPWQFLVQVRPPSPQRILELMPMDGCFGCAHWAIVLAFFPETNAKMSFPTWICSQVLFNLGITGLFENTTIASGFYLCFWNHPFQTHASLYPHHTSSYLYYRFGWLNPRASALIMSGGWWTTSHIPW